MSEIAVGIDLGTSNSCVSIARGGQVEVLPNAYGENTTASVVAFHEDGMIEVGNRAKANIIHDPENTIYSAKRLIGRYFFSEEVKKAQAVCAYEIIEGPNHGVRVMAREEAFSLPEVSAMVLREMKQLAEAHLGEEVIKAVITVPAYFNDNQRQATKDAGKIAGIEVLRILNEPTAAALAYGFGKSLNQRVAVYDLGGGTFDVSVLEIGKDIFEVLSTCGDTFLGGDDFDDRLIDLLADEFVAKEGINLRGDPYAFEKIKVAAEEAKKTLSYQDQAAVHIPDIITGEDGTPRSIEREITHSEYASLVQDLVMRTFKVCDEALQQADLTTRDLDGVILVGGPTRLPLIRQAVSDYFQMEVKDDVDPDEVVAKGAAIHAASLVGDGDSEDAFLLDVTPLDLRIGVAGGLAEPVIEANTPVPIEQTRRFTTTRDFQESVQIRVFQGDSRMAEDNELLGQFEFAGFKKARRGDVAIDVTFEINADGIVSVTAFDPETEERASTNITLSSGLSMEELEEIIEQDKTARVHTSATPESGVPAAAVAAAAAAPIDEIAPVESAMEAVGEAAAAPDGASDPAADDDSAIDLAAASDADFDLSSDADDSLPSSPAEDELEYDVDALASEGSMDLEVGSDDVPEIAAGTTSAVELVPEPTLEEPDEPAANEAGLDLAAEADGDLDLLTSDDAVEFASEDDAGPMADDEIDLAADPEDAAELMDIDGDEIDLAADPEDAAELMDIGSDEIDLAAEADAALDLAAGCDDEIDLAAEVDAGSLADLDDEVRVDADGSDEIDIATSALGLAEGEDVELKVGACDDPVALMPSHTDLPEEGSGGPVDASLLYSSGSEDSGPLELGDASAEPAAISETAPISETGGELEVDEDASMDLDLDELDLDGAVPAADDTDAADLAAQLAVTEPNFTQPGDSDEFSDPAESDVAELELTTPVDDDVHPDDIYAPQVEIDPEQKEALFDTDTTNLSEYGKEK